MSDYDFIPKTTLLDKLVIFIVLSLIAGSIIVTLIAAFNYFLGGE